MSYTTFDYEKVAISSQSISMGEQITITATIYNSGKYDGSEVAQLHVRDLYGNGISRPLLELK